MWDYSKKYPVGLTEASAASSLWVSFSLCTASLPHFPTCASPESTPSCTCPNPTWSNPPRRPPPWSVSNDWPFIPVAVLKEHWIVSSSCYQPPPKLPLLSFMHPVLPFSIPIFSVIHSKLIRVGSYGLQPRIRINTFFASFLMSFNVFELFMYHRLKP